MPPCGNCQESLPARLAQKTFSLALLRMIPTLGLKPSESIMLAPVVLLLCQEFFHKARIPSTKHTALENRHPSRFRQSYPLLPLILACAISITGFADFIGLQKQHLRYTLIGVDFCWQRRCIRKFQCYMPLPFGFQRGYIDNYPTASIGRLPEANGQNVARNAEIFNRDPASPSRTCPLSNGSIMPCSLAIFLIQRSDFMLIFLQSG